MEFLLQKVLMVLTLLHRRASGSLQPAQLQALAHTCFLALRAADTCEVSLSMGLYRTLRCPQHMLVATGSKAVSGGGEVGE